jgi:hypothetical protein
MGRRYILGSDAECLDRVDRFQYPFDLGPAGKAEQDFAARPYTWHCRDWLSRLRSTQNVNSGDDRAMLIRRPADEGEDAFGRKRNDAPAAVDDAFLRDFPESDPALDASLLPIEFNLGEIVHRT